MLPCSLPVPAPQGLTDRRAARAALGLTIAALCTAAPGTAQAQVIEDGRPDVPAAGGLTTTVPSSWLGQQGSSFGVASTSGVVLGPLSGIGAYASVLDPDGELELEREIALGSAWKAPTVQSPILFPSPGAGTSTGVRTSAAGTLHFARSQGSPGSLKTSSRVVGSGSLWRTPDTIFSGLNPTAQVYDIAVADNGDEFVAWVQFNAANGTSTLQAKVRRAGQNFVALPGVTVPNSPMITGLTIAASPSGAFAIFLSRSEGKQTWRLPAGGTVLSPEDPSANLPGEGKIAAAIESADGWRFALIEQASMGLGVKLARRSPAGVWLEPVTVIGVGGPTKRTLEPTDYRQLGRAVILPGASGAATVVLSNAPQGGERFTVGSFEVGPTGATSSQVMVRGTAGESAGWFDAVSKDGRQSVLWGTRFGTDDVGATVAVQQRTDTGAWSTPVQLDTQSLVGFKGDLQYSGTDLYAAWGFDDGDDAGLRSRLQDLTGPSLRDLRVPQTASVGVAASLSVNASDALGDVASVAWDLGNGERVTGSQVSARYAAPGTYIVTLTVTDRAGNATTVSQQIQVTGAPASTPTAPSPTPKPATGAGTPTPAPSALAPVALAGTAGTSALRLDLVLRPRAGSRACPTVSRVRTRAFSVTAAGRAAAARRIVSRALTITPVSGGCRVQGTLTLRQPVASGARIGITVRAAGFRVRSPRIVVR